MNDNIIYLNDASPVEDNGLGDNVELSITSYDDIDDVLSSSESYNRKIAALKTEREKAISFINYMDSALYSFEHDDEYLTTMEDKHEDLKEELKTDIPLALGSIMSTIGSLYGFFGSMGSIERLNDPFYTFVFAVLGILSAAGATYYTKESTVNTLESRKYNKEIKRYRKYLGK